MDKLRALQYFVASAKSGSFGRAAGQFGVTVPAVQKLVTQLESSLGGSLFTRSPQGLTLTSQGARYLFEVETLLAELERADQRVRPRGDELSGTVVVGAAPYLVERMFAPSLNDFIARYPNIMLDFRYFDPSEDLAHSGIDVYLSYGWYSPPNLVERVLCVPRFVTVGTSEFWRKHGTPSHPSDLAGVPCAVLRSFAGTLMDLWDYEKEGEVVRVALKSVACFDNVQRSALMKWVLAGEATFRTSDYLLGSLLESGEVVPVLTDWHALGSPPVKLHYLREARTYPAVNAVIDFIASLFGTDNAGGSNHAVSSRPDWATKKLPRASLYLNDSKRA